MSKKKILMIIISVGGIAVLGVAAGNMLNQGSNYEKDSGLQSRIAPDQIVSGGPPRDGITSIDKPRFVSVLEAYKFFQNF